MNEGINILTKSVKKLEESASSINKNNPSAVDSIKDIALMLIPAINVAKNEPINHDYLDTLDDLDSRVASVVSSLSSS